MMTLGYTHLIPSDIGIRNQGIEANLPSSSGMEGGVAGNSASGANQQQGHQQHCATSQYSLLCPRLNNSQQQRQHASLSGVEGNGPWWKSLTKKYVILCCICGGSAVLLGVIFISIYFTLLYYTSSLQYFETIPTYAPAVVLIITGLLVMCFSRRRNRYAYLIKLTGGCCLVCAVLCVVITVTTTVIHMNRLQTLRECVYTQKSKMCTCFAGIGDEEGSAKYIFNNTPDCEVVHGSLYTCLRAMFGLSVIGILVCIFSSMLVYQLLSHEKKKMYWEQLEMRRRFYYRQPSHPLYCNCYDDYGFAASAAPPPHHDMYHWQPWDISSDRCWPIRGITPRPAFTGDENGGSGSQRSILVGSTGHRASGWNWLPWSRNRNQSGGGGSNVNVPLNNTINNNSEQLSTIANINHNDFDNDGQVNRVQNNFNDDTSPRLPSFSAVHPYWSAETRFGGTNSTGRRNGRRRRSNDAVFHHLSMTPPSRYQSPFCVAESSYGPPISFSAYNSLSRHMWGPPPPYSQQPSVENVVDNNINRTIVEQNASLHLRQFFRAATIANPGNNNVRNADSEQTQLSQQRQNSLEIQPNENSVTNHQSIKTYSNDLMVDCVVSEDAANSHIYDNNSVCKSSPLYYAGKTFISEGTNTLPNIQHRKEKETQVYTSKSASYLPSRALCEVWHPSRRSNCGIFSHRSCSVSSGSQSTSSCSSNSTSSRSSTSGDSFEIESDFHSSVLVSTSSSSAESSNPNAFPTDILCVRSLPNLNITSIAVPKAFQNMPLPQSSPPPLPPPTSRAVKKREIHVKDKPNLDMRKVLNASNPVKTESFPTLPLQSVTLINTRIGGFYAKNDGRVMDFVDDEPKSKSVGNLPLPSNPNIHDTHILPNNDNIIVTFKSVHV